MALKYRACAQKQSLKAIQQGPPEPPWGSIRAPAGHPRALPERPHGPHWAAEGPLALPLAPFGVPLGLPLAFLGHLGLQDIF